MDGVSRRSFLKGAALTVGTVALPSRPWARVLGANDDVRVAVVGFRGKGSQHIEAFCKMKGVRVVALCDPDRRVLERGMQPFRDRNEPIVGYTDVRRLLENPDVDAISTATPHHWHALITIWACQAGKDVYVEKICSHNIWEGRKMVEAARKYNRVVQVGSQKRSDPGLIEAVDWIRAGNLGRITLCRGLCYKRRGSIGKVTAPQPVPDHIDYDLWVGPSSVKPLMRRRLHYDWHWFWDTGNGDLGNQGIHEMDIVRWFAGHTKPSPRVISVGGRFGYDDDGETPNTEIAYHDYPDIPIVFEVRGLPVKPGMKTMPHYKGVRIGNVIHCEGGHFAGAFAYNRKGKRVKRFRRDGGGRHFANFIKAVRSRKTEDNRADILDGHLSAILCHAGSISNRLGQELRPEAAMERVAAFPAAQECLERLQGHLRTHAINVAKTPIVTGAWLQMDPKAERFVGPLADEANQLVRREYREPFVVPEEV